MLLPEEREEDGEGESVLGEGRPREAEITRGEKMDEEEVKTNKKLLN
jgi:hypothetical protein